MREPIPSDHPEAICQRCGGRNFPWHVESKLWNEVMRNPYREAIVCPNCFLATAEEKRIYPELGWILANETIADAMKEEYKQRMGNQIVGVA